MATLKGKPEERQAGFKRKEGEKERKNEHAEAYAERQRSKRKCLRRKIKRHAFLRSAGFAHSDGKVGCMKTINNFRQAISIHFMCVCINTLRSRDRHFIKLSMTLLY